MTKPALAVDDVTQDDLTFLRALKIAWEFDTPHDGITPAIYWDEWQLADLREAGISLETDDEFLRKRGIAPLEEF